MPANGRQDLIRRLKVKQVVALCKKKKAMFVISDFRHDEMTSALLSDIYVAYSGIYLRTFRDNLLLPTSQVCPETSVRNWQYSLLDISEERRPRDRPRPHPELCTFSGVETVGNKATFLSCGLNAVHLIADKMSPRGTTSIFPHVLLQRFQIGHSLYCHLRPRRKLHRSLESSVHNTQMSRQMSGQTVPSTD